MDASKRILIAIDDSEASMRAVAYVAAIIGGGADFQIYLIHVLPALPSDILDIPWVDTPKLAGRAKERFHAAQTRWQDRAAQAAQPMFTQAKALLQEAGILDQMVETQCVPSFEIRETETSILDAARTHQCGTIVVGREAFSGFRELVHHHIGDRILPKGRGLAIWVVE